MPLNAPQVQPPDAGVLASLDGDGAARTIPRDAPSSPPPQLPSGVTADITEKKMQAGVGLATFVLWMASGTIAVFLAYLFVMDFMIGNDVREQFGRATQVLLSENYPVDPQALDQFSTNLFMARRNSAFAMSTENTENAAEVLQALSLVATFTESQRTQLGTCTPLPVGADRNATLDRCLAAMASAKQALVASRAEQRMKLAQDAINGLGTQRKGMHDFWLQAAQLILLNLLLPVLTALLGYIFGTQSAPSRNS